MVPMLADRGLSWLDSGLQRPELPEGLAQLNGLRSGGYRRRYEALVNVHVSTHEATEPSPNKAEACRMVEAKKICRSARVCVFIYLMGSADEPPQTGVPPVPQEFRMVRT